MNVCVCVCVGVYIPVHVCVLLVYMCMRVCMHICLLVYFTVTQRRYRFRKAIEFLKLTFKNEGLLTLWRGNSATMTRVIPFAAIQFTSYEQYKLLLRPDDSRQMYDIIIIM